MTRFPPGPLAVSLGDPAGIGPEVIAKCWDNRAAFDLPPFVAIGDPRSIARVWDGPIELIDDPRQADAAFDYALAADPDRGGRRRHARPPERRRRALLARFARDRGRAWRAPDRPRRWSPARCPRSSFTRSASRIPGQTEFVAERCGVSRGNVAMMLAGPTLRTVPVTTHLPLAEVAERICRRR